MDLAERTGSERQHCGFPRQGRECALSLIPRRRADFAKILRENEIRVEGAEKLGVDRVDRSANPQLCSHRRINFGRRHVVERNGAVHDHRPRPRFGRIVALVRYADNVVAEAERKGELRC